MTAASDQTAANVADEERCWRAALWAVLAATLARLVWLAIGASDLYPDEAQYWLWSLHPAFGYYSKPPMVAWLIALTTRLFGEDEAAIRLAAPLLHFATGLVIYALARRLYDARTALWSAVAYITLPGVSASAALITTDAPLLLCWAVALYAFVRAREPGGTRWWLVVGIAAGLGLLSKYAMAYWLLSALFYLLLVRDERIHLRRFAGAAALALAIYAPNFLWNAANGFASYLHTRDNANLGGPLFHPAQFLEFFASQFGVFGPIFFAALLLIVAGATIWIQHTRQTKWVDPADISTHFRVLMWGDGLRLIRQHPFFGVGMETVRLHYREWNIRGFIQYNVMSHFHSTYLQIGVERGIPALIAWLWFSIAYGVFLWRLILRSRAYSRFALVVAVGALAGLIAFSFTSLFHYNLGEESVAMMFYFYFGLAIALERMIDIPGAIDVG